MFLKMTDEEYFSRSEISNSDLGLIKTSINKYLCKEQKESTPDMDVGTAYHYLILTPELFDKYVKVWDKSKGTLKSLRASLEPEQVAISQENYEMLFKMQDVLMAHPCSDLLVGEKEIVGLFEYSDIDCRMKIDVLNHKEKRIIDLKTTKSDISTIHKLRNVVAEYAYYRQECFYELGTMNILKEPYTATFIIQEKEAPYDLRTFELSPEFWDYAQIEVDRLILKYKNYLENKDKKEFSFGYDTKTAIIEIPNWLQNTIMEL